MHCPYCHLDYTFEDPCFCAPFNSVVENFGSLTELPVEDAPVLASSTLLGSIAAD